MGLAPNIKKNRTFTLKQCNCCGQSFGSEGFAPTKSFFYPDGVLPVCDNCVDQKIGTEGDWATVNKLCQIADIPFIPSQWQEIWQMNNIGAFHRYATIFMASEYESLGWEEYFTKFKQLKKDGMIEDELPKLAEQKRKEQKERWGANYDNEALDYLDGLFNGLMTTQNVNGALQMDQALKICKMSYEIDRRISEGSEFDKLLSSYDKLVKTAEFTPKNVKNLNDFDSVGELVKWLEKRGWRNKFYDSVTRDIVDETIKNIQNFNQRLYTNETGIGDSISERIKALKSVKEIENYYDTDKKYDLEQYDNDGYNDLIKDEEFNADITDAEV